VVYLARDAFGVKRIECQPNRLALVLGLALLLAALAGLGQFAIAREQDLLVPAFELVFGSDVADGAMQAHVVVMSDVIGEKATGI
jgi:hypothetical protein